MKKNVELTPEIIKAVYDDDIMNKHGMTKEKFVIILIDVVIISINFVKSIFLIIIIFLF